MHVAVQRAVDRHTAGFEKRIQHTDTELIQHQFDAIGRLTPARATQRCPLIAAPQVDAAYLKALAVDIRVTVAGIETPQLAAYRQLRRVDHQVHPLAVRQQSEVDIAAAQSLLAVVPIQTAVGAAVRTLQRDIGALRQHQITNLDLLTCQSHTVAVGHRAAVHTDVVHAQAAPADGVRPDNGLEGFHFVIVQLHACAACQQQSRFKEFHHTAAAFPLGAQLEVAYLSPRFDACCLLHFAIGPGIGDHRHKVGQEGPHHLSDIAVFVIASHLGVDDVASQSHILPVAALADRQLSLVDPALASGGRQVQPIDAHASPRVALAHIRIAACNLAVYASFIVGAAPQPQSFQVERLDIHLRGVEHALFAILQGSLARHLAQGIIHIHQGGKAASLSLDAERGLVGYAVAFDHGMPQVTLGVRLHSARIEAATRKAHLKTAARQPLVGSQLHNVEPVGEQSAAVGIFAGGVLSHPHVAGQVAGLAGNIQLGAEIVYPAFKLGLGVDMVHLFQQFLSLQRHPCRMPHSGKVGVCGVQAIEPCIDIGRINLGQPLHRAVELQVRLVAEGKPYTLCIEVTHGASEPATDVDLLVHTPQGLGPPASVAHTAIGAVEEVAVERHAVEEMAHRLPSVVVEHHIAHQARVAGLQYHIRRRNATTGNEDVHTHLLHLKARALVRNEPLDAARHIVGGHSHIAHPRLYVAPGLMLHVHSGTAAPLLARPAVLQVVPIGDVVENQIVDQHGEHAAVRFLLRGRVVAGVVIDYMPEVKAIAVDGQMIVHIVQTRLAEGEAAVAIREAGKAERHFACRADSVVVGAHQQHVAQHQMVERIAAQRPNPDLAAPGLAAAAADV